MCKVDEPVCLFLSLSFSLSPSLREKCGRRRACSHATQASTENNSSTVREHILVQYENTFSSCYPEISTRIFTLPISSLFFSPVLLLPPLFFSSAAASSCDERCALWGTRWGTWWGTRWRTILFSTCLSSVRMLPLRFLFFLNATYSFVFAVKTTTPWFVFVVVRGFLLFFNATYSFVFPSSSFPLLLSHAARIPWLSLEFFPALFSTWPFFLLGEGRRLLCSSASAAFCCHENGPQTCVCVYAYVSVDCLCACVLIVCVCVCVCADCECVCVDSVYFPLFVFPL